MAVEKRVLFRSWWLPWALVAPQLVIVTIFFFWPAGQALFQSVLREDAFGTSSEFVGLENFKTLFADETYIASFRTTAVFSALVAVIGLSVSLLLAVMADRVVRGATAYKTLMIWPYAVAPAIAGVLWLFMFAPSIGVVSYALRSAGMDWNHLLNGGHAMTLIVLAAVWKGVRVRDLLERAGVKDGAGFVMGHAEYGYTANLPLADAMRDESLVVYEYDGQPIEPIHGGPVRLLVPNLYFWKSPKWLRGIELRETDAPGFWEQNGYHMYGDPFREQRFWGD